jgi:F420-dependent oxidoreductase-like protein
MQGIRIGLGMGDGGGASLDEIVASCRKAETDGFATLWFANIFGFDAMTLAAIVGRETRTVEIGTAVAPTHSRHPLYMAQQALSTQIAARGRFVLGLGPSHQLVIENLLGLSYAHPARHVREYVTVVKELLQTGKTSFQGTQYRVNASLSLKTDKPCPVLIGGLGPRMRRIAGELADGTLTWMTGPRTLGGTLVPEIRAAARAAGRPEPRIVAGLPIALTNDPAGAREAASKIFSLYGQLPSYRAMLDLEGAASPGDIVIAGDERTIENAVRGLASAGVTDLSASPYPCGSDGAATVKRTTAFLAELAKRS